MVALAYLEELGRRGEVRRRHAIEQLPVRVGRGYGSGVILDDPFVAAEHLEIRSASDGGLEAVDLGSLNGSFRTNGAERFSTTRIQGDDLLRIGHTQLRVRLPGQPVPEERPLPRPSWSRHPGVFFASMGSLGAIVTGTAFVATSDTDLSGVVAMPATVVLALLAWTATWALVCRTPQGNANFTAHGIIAFLGSTVVLLVDTLAGYADFAFQLQAAKPLSLCCVASVLAILLYRHLRLTVRSSPRFIGAIAVLVVAILVGGMEGYQAIRDSNKPGLQIYNAAIKPGAFLASAGITPVQFVNEVETLRVKADREVDAIAQK